MEVHDYLVCTRSALQAVRTHVEDALQAWAADWMGASAELSVQCFPFELPEREDLSDAWCQFTGRWGSAWVRADAQSIASAALFGVQSTDGDGVAVSVADQAVRALLERLTDSQTPPLKMDALPALALAPGRQTMRVEIRTGELLLELVVQGSRAEGLRSSKKLSPPLTRLDIALTGQALPLRARLGETEINLGALQDLAVGDIIRLDRQLDQPAELILLDEKLPCRGYLGMLDGRIAVEIGR